MEQRDGGEAMAVEQASWKQPMQGPVLGPQEVQGSQEARSMFPGALNSCHQWEGSRTLRTQGMQVEPSSLFQTQLSSQQNVAP